MNILVISSILPVTSAFNDNDFIFHLYGNYRELYQGDKIVIIKPVKYDLNIRTILRGETRLQKLNQKLHWQVNNFQVEIFPYFASWSLRNLHAVLSGTTYALNRKRIHNLFKTDSFEIIHAQFILPDGLLARQISRKYNIPYLVSTHNELFYFDHFYSRRVACRILKRATFVNPPSYTNLLYFRNIGLTNGFQMPYGFYGDFIRTQRISTDGEVKILSVCQLIKLKNIDKVIEAMDRIRSRFQFQYTIIGKGPEKAYLQELVSRIGLQDRVVFIDHIPHDRIADEMYRHDLFIMPSYFETFGRVYFEVMAMGIPIICARNSGIYGLFRENEEGLAVDHRSVEEIADALAYMIGNREERLRIGLNGQDLVKRFTWENLARELHQKYLDSVSQGN
jgi:teichuronic acid biosynthesis glycosyltransferase TuaC